MLHLTAIPTFGENDMTLDTNKTDYAVSITKGILGAIPVVGPLAAEVIGNLIPNQRIDRIKRLLNILEEKVKELDKERLDNEFRKEEFIDLLEDGFYQAARALSKDRLEQISNLIANGLKEEDADYIRYKKFLSLLASLNDIEVMFLIMYGRFEMHDNSYMEKHIDVLRLKPATLGSSQEDIEKSIVQETYKSHLAELGLVRPRFEKPKKGEYPEFDEKTGKMKASGYELTPLGRMLLKYIGEKTIYDK
jgi:hypothetical protein